MWDLQTFQTSALWDVVQEQINFIDILSVYFQNLQEKIR